MAKTYVQTPGNWSRITQNLVYDKENCIRQILHAKKCLICDTCTILQYANLAADSNFFRYIHDAFDIVLIPRVILMELSSEDAKVKEEHISFLEKLHQEKEIYLFDEEWCYSYLKIAFDKTDEELNTILINTIKFIKKVFNNCVDTFFEDSAQINRYFKRTPTSEVYTEFFTNIRSKKESEDSLGEELIAMMVVLMSNIVEVRPGKFELLSNDRKSYPALTQTKRYIHHKYGWDSFMCRTTCNIAHVLYKAGYMNQDELRDFVSVSYVNGSIRCFGAGKNDLECKEYHVTIDEFLELVVYDKLFKVMY